MEKVVRQVVFAACVASSVALAWSPAVAGQTERQRGRDAREALRDERDQRRALHRTERRLRREVREALRRDRDLRGIEVSVQGGEATLTGRVPTVGARRQAIERALQVDGIETIASELRVGDRLE